MQHLVPTTPTQPDPQLLLVQRTMSQGAKHPGMHTRDPELIEGLMERNTEHLMEILPAPGAQDKVQIHTADQRHQNEETMGVARLHHVMKDTVHVTHTGMHV